MIGAITVYLKDLIFSLLNYRQSNLHYFDFTQTQLYICVIRLIFTFIIYNDCCQLICLPLDIVTLNINRFRRVNRPPKIINMEYH